jgi:beta-alanine--pyruvate transaminase
MRKKLFWNGLPIKFTGDAAIIAPPLVAVKDRIDEIVRIPRATLEAEMKKAA